jgi:UDPglucose 6-dehydrogenase
MGYDPRIGPHFLDAGLGFGGSCFPKDVLALAYMAEEKGRNSQLLQAVMDINTDRRRQIVEKTVDLVGDLNGKVVGLLGLTFKPNTDDLREAPALDVAQRLIKGGAIVKAYDPVGMERAKDLLTNVEMAEDPYLLAQDCDVLIICTEWNEFKQLDLERIHRLMKQPLIVDGRNIYEPSVMKNLGFQYRGIGRGYDLNGNPVENHNGREVEVLGEVAHDG